MAVQMIGSGMHLQKLSSLKPLGHARLQKNGFLHLQVTGSNCLPLRHFLGLQGFGGGRGNSGNCGFSGNSGSSGKIETHLQGGISL